LDEDGHLTLFALPDWNTFFKEVAENGYSSDGILIEKTVFYFYCNIISFEIFHLKVFLLSSK
jgi:hypothetical protein